MGKSKKAESVKKNGVSAAAKRATETIKLLCATTGLVLTDTYAVEKELMKVNSVSAEKHFTRWAKDAQG